MLLHTVPSYQPQQLRDPTVMLTSLHIPLSSCVQGLLHEATGEGKKALDFYMIVSSLFAQRRALAGRPLLDQARWCAAEGLPC